MAPSALLLAFLASLLAFSSSDMDKKAAIDKMEKAGLVFQSAFEMLGKDGYDFEKFKGFVSKALPFVKTLGPAFALLAMFVEEKNEVLDEVKSKFKETNLKLDQMNLKMDALTRIMKEEFQKLQYNMESMKLAQVQENKELYQNDSTPTTLQMLRDECRDSQPQNVMVAIYKMITTARITQDFLGTIFESAEYDAGAWLRWSEAIITDFLHAMALHQVCLGVHINDDKTRPTEEEMERQASVYQAKLEVVLAMLQEKAAIIESDWSKVQLVKDIEDEMTRLGTGKTEQEVAETLYQKLSRKYIQAYFGVHVFENTDSKFGKIFSDTLAKQVAHAQTERTALVNWKPKAQRVYGQAEAAAKLCNGFGCPKSNRPWNYLERFSDHLLNRNAGAVNQKYFSTVFGIVYGYGQLSSDKGRVNKIGSKYDSENTYVYKLEKCEQFWMGGASHFRLFSFEVFAIFGF